MRGAITRVRLAPTNAESATMINVTAILIQMARGSRPSRCATPRNPNEC
jgi:hypothetical protein